MDFNQHAMLKNALMKSYCCCVIMKNISGLRWIRPLYCWCMKIRGYNTGNFCCFAVFLSH